MKLCDICGIENDNHHNAVGPVSIRFEGYHATHWTHKDAKHYWNLEICPKCTKELKLEIDATIKEFKGE